MSEVKRPKLSLETVEQIMGMLINHDDLTRDQMYDWAWELQMAKEGRRKSTADPDKNWAVLWADGSGAFVGSYESYEHFMHVYGGYTALSEEKLVSLIADLLLSLMEMREKHD